MFPSFDEINVGDIFGGTTGYSMRLPKWFKVVKKTAKQLRLIELQEDILSGQRNGQWYSIPSDRVQTDFDGNEVAPRVGTMRVSKIDNKPWAIRINSRYEKVYLSTKYNGVDDALYGDDMD